MRKNSRKSPYWTSERNNALYCHFTTNFFHPPAASHYWQNRQLLRSAELPRRHALCVTARGVGGRFASCRDMDVAVSFSMEFFLGKNSQSKDWRECQSLDRTQGRTRRKPTLYRKLGGASESLSDGSKLPRKAERAISVGPLYPPRRTRLVPENAPMGSVSASPG